MTKPIMLTVNIPFDGFYNSMYSDAIDREEEQFAEYRTDTYEKDDKDKEGYWPESLRLDSAEYADILMDVSDYSKAYDQVARDYVASFDHIAGDAFGMSVKDTRSTYNYETKEFGKQEYQRPSIRATFESMDSPREYNFSTDRVYCDIPLSVIRELFKRSKADKHATLAAVIKSRFTSCSGFISGYSNCLQDWLSKSLTDWDHNELGTLLIAAMRLADQDVESDDFRDEIFSATIGDEGAYSAWESAVDWSTFESKRAEKRAEKLAEWIEEDRASFESWFSTNHADYCELVAADPSLFTAFEFTAELPYRCSETLDLFASDNG